MTVLEKYQTKLSAMDSMAELDAFVQGPLSHIVML